MNTVYDWVTVAIFACLVTLFLHRSTGAERPDDPLWPYLLASAGCAVTNWLGNEGYHLAAVAMLSATLGFAWFRLRPLRR